MLQQLLLQVVFILFPTLLYYTILKNNTYLKKYNSLMVGFLSSLAILLCMSFPVSFGTGNMMDLRTIPWILSFLYGSFPIGIFVTIMMFTFRLFIGGIGLYGVLAVYSLSVILLFIYFRNYETFTYTKKVKSTLILTAINSLLIILSIQLMFGFSSNNVYVFYLFFIIMHILMMWICIYVIETIREHGQLRVELQKSEKLNIVGQMAASVAHEIRNPMTVVNGFVQILQQDKDTPEKHREHYEIITQELRRAETILNDYLTLAKPQAEKLETINIHEQINRINHTLSSYALMKSVSVEYHLPPENNYLIKGCPEKFQQVLINIIKNAIEVSTKGEVVTVSISKNRNFYYIFIKDNGCGMSKDELQVLGTPFYSLKERGTGLGLTISYSIIHSMEGTIEVTSQKGKGTTFMIGLPVIKRSLV
ncbi:sensor histidine kinase [Alkalihalobacterium elongatum]|uniref:sensor histidine kinase n=1 Tax=Alkalihalobacterium elongatum TaxID=2675466 RepID=UPI001C1F4923|nr:HAMP domain-containing sensor histidine kinase [Alkalihalobacterium elongatum]